MSVNFMRILSNQKEGSKVYIIESKYSDIELRFCDAVYEVTNFADEESKFEENSLVLRVEAIYLKFYNERSGDKIDIQFYIRDDGDIKVIGDDVAFYTFKYRSQSGVDGNVIKKDFYDKVGAWVKDNVDLISEKRKEWWNDMLNVLIKMRNKRLFEIDVLNKRIDIMEDKINGNR